MSEKKVTIGFTNEEFLRIQELAQEQGVSIAQYIKSKVIISNEFDLRYEELLQKVNQFEQGKEFSIKELWETNEWNCISRGVRLSLGRHFYRNVVETQPPKIDNVKKMGFGVAGIMRYMKI